MTPWHDWDPSAVYIALTSAGLLVLLVLARLAR